MSPDPCAITIACSLQLGALAERIDDWRALVASSVVSMRSEPADVHLVLDNSDRALVTAAALAQREKRCCPFFDVRIEVGADRHTLHLSVPEGAEEAMASFVAMLRS